MTDLISQNGELHMSENVRNCPIGENGLNDKQLAAIEMLVLGKAVGAVAKAVEIDPRTLHRWRQDELFRAALAERRSQVWGPATDRLKDLVHPSLEVLAEHLADRYDRARFRAASTVLRLVNLKHQGAEFE
jgi:hypothetical protein